MAKVKELKNEAQLGSAERTIMQAYQELGSATIQQLADHLEEPYAKVWRRHKVLVDAGWVEVDHEATGLNVKQKFYRSTRIINNGFDIYIEDPRTGASEKLSWNEFLRILAASNGPTKLALNWSKLLEAVTNLTANALAEFNEKGSVQEKTLLEIRASLFEYRELLQRELSMVNQLIKDDRLWDPDLLWQNVIKYTSTPLSTDAIKALLVKIHARYTLQYDEGTEGNDDPDD